MEEVMEIGDNVMQIEDGRAHNGVIIGKRKIGPQTEMQVRWHKGYCSWELAVSLDMADDA